ncbi:MAG TPA: SMI1/KNR4 family protein [Byssovorax sp.]
MRWDRSIRAIRDKKLEIARLDPRRGMPVAPPPGATLRAVAAVERKLGRELPSDFAAFLTEHDGFPDLLHGTSLLSTHHLARGTYDGLARAVIDLGEPDDAPSTLVPFGVDAKGETIFAWDTASAGADGELEVVIWSNDIGARLPNFAAFLDFVDDVLEADVTSLRAERAPRARPTTATSGAKRGRLDSVSGFG